MNVDAENEISRAFEAFHASVCNWGLSGGGVLSDPLPEKERRPLATKYKRLARTITAAAEGVSAIVEGEKAPALKANDAWLRERTATLAEFAAELESQAAAFESVRVRKGRIGTPAFDRFVLSLRKAYRTSGGTRNYTEIDGAFSGEPIDFILEICAQIEGAVPECSMPGGVYRANAIGRTLKSHPLR